MKALVLFLTSLLIGCSAPDPVAETAPEVPTEEPSQVSDEPVYEDHTHAAWVISSSFSDDDIEAILVAGDAWSISTKGRVQLTFTVEDIKEPGPWTIFKAPLDDDCCAGITNAAHNQILIDPVAYEDSWCVGEVWHIAAHELGHSLGIIKHGGDGVMAEHKPSCYAHFTRSDIDMFEAANPLPSVE